MRLDVISERLIIDILQIVGGPNARTDYHINETAEWFYQYRGAMLLKIVDEGKFRDITIGEGEMFLLPRKLLFPDVPGFFSHALANTPHNPVRFAKTVGIVLEQPRPADSKDRLRWYCQNCAAIVHEASFHCTDLGTQIKEAVEGFRNDHEKRKCGKCGELADVVPKDKAPNPNE